MNQITGKTRLIGLIGNPVSHSISPIMQNAALKEMGLNWRYLPLPCESKDLQTVLEGLRKLNFKGLNITIPHKKSVAQLCSDLCPLAKRLQAVNTLLPYEKDKWKGTNTDVIGFLAPIRNKNWKSKKAVVIGCGGSAKAVLAGLEELHFSSIVIIGRKNIALNKFLQEIKISNSLNPLITGMLNTDKKLINHIEAADLIINTTPVGMSNFSESQENDSTMPLNETIWHCLNSNVTLYDLVYTPRPTKWLKFGNRIGCNTIDGLEMLIHQGAASLALWSNNKNIPIATMRQAAITSLSK